jgi:hypothetical protein
MVRSCPIHGAFKLSSILRPFDKLRVLSKVEALTQDGELALRQAQGGERS